MVRGVDTVQTRDGAVVIQDSNARLSVRSQRRGGKGKNVPNPTGLFNQLKLGGKKAGDGVHEMFQSFERESPTFVHFFKKENEPKNRYQSEILLYDKTRVILKEGEGDYYHASYVDGNDIPKQYVLAQAPFTADTEIDFIRMLAQLKPEVVILLLKLDGDEGKHLFAPTKDESKTVGPYTVKTDDATKDKNFDHLTISISGKAELSKLPVCVFSSWTEENKVPLEDMSAFFSYVRKCVPSLKGREASQVIVCPTGANRAGVWMMYDSEAERMKTKGRIRFTDSAKALRFQRSNTLDTQEIFDQVIQALLAFAKAL
uniref:Tyrosine-protein phosphatase domain-containing protein n=1 Tax=Panagrellus redivivus TaxID=6233 RepID=A0A7E4ULR0_PANRE